MKTSLKSNLIIIFSFAINIGISDWYLFSRLCRPSTALVRAVFVATFGLSASLLELCLWEINGTLQKEARGVAWQIVVNVLLADLILVVPLISSHMLFDGYILKSMSRVYRLLLPTIPFLGFLYLFYQLGSFLPTERNIFLQIPDRTLTEECVLRVGAMGITLMAVLSGFGSICAGWETYLTPHRLVTEEDVVRARTSVEITQDLINEKRRKAAQIEERIHENAQSQSFKNRVLTSVRGSSDHQELSTLEAELKGLVQMLSSLQSQYSSLETLYIRRSQRNTPMGIVSFITRHSFAMYCVYRILATTWSSLRLLLGIRSTPIAEEDPISKALALLTKAWLTTTKVPFDLEAYRRLIGFILVGVVIVGSISAVMNTLQRLAKSSPLGAVTSTLWMCWLSGTYFISTAVMLRSNLPEKYVGGIGSALGQSLRRGLFEEWFDFVFFVVVVVTGVGLVVARSWSDEVIELEGKEV